MSKNKQMKYLSLFTFLEIGIFCNINVFTVDFDQFDASLLNKIINIFIQQGCKKFLFLSFFY